MTVTADVLKPSIDPREVRLAELEAQLRQRDAQIEQLQRRIAELEQRLAELDYAGKHQATPFARKQRKKNPTRLGRKPVRVGLRFAPGQRPTRWRRRKSNRWRPVRCAVAR
jgi:hypothetical protein